MAYMGCADIWYDMNVDVMVYFMAGRFIVYGAVFSNLIRALPMSRERVG